MSYTAPRLAAATCFVVALVLLQISEVSSLRCLPCAPDVECPTLPDDCQPTKRPCGCCPECKGKVGAECSNMGLNCESGLMCVNKLGLAIPIVKWHYISFKGQCQKVEMCQLLKRPWYELIP